VAGTKSYLAKTGAHEQKWFVVDATDKVLGRLASEIALVLMGKHRPTYTAHVDTGDFVIVLNADKVRLTGNKMETKEYSWFTGYTRRRIITAQKRLESEPTGILYDAVRRMLPKNKLGTKMLNKLKLYTGDEHDHQAQRPEKLDI
jgi:large subunit ribosomal protein L13